MEGICLKLVQAFIVSFSAACHNTYKNHFLDASPLATAVLPPPTSFVPTSVPGAYTRALFTPVSALFLAAGSWRGTLQSTGLCRMAPAPDMPLQSAAASAVTPAAAQAAGGESTLGEAESVVRLLLCLSNPVFLAAHLELPILLVAAAAAALVELLFLSHTLKHLPASEGVPLMNAALTVSMGLGGLTLLGAAPGSAFGWSVGLVLLVVGVGVLGFGGKTWLAVRRFAIHSLRTRTRCTASLEYVGYFGCRSRTEDLAGAGSIGSGSEDYTVHCRSDGEESAAATVGAGRTGLSTLQGLEDMESMLRTALQPVTGKRAAWEAVSSTAGVPPVVAWPPKATRTSRNVDAVGKTGGTTFAPYSGNSEQCTRGQKEGRCGPIDALPHMYKVPGTADAEAEGRDHELKNPLLTHSEQEMTPWLDPGDPHRSTTVFVVPGRGYGNSYAHAYVLRAPEAAGSPQKQIHYKAKLRGHHGAQGVLQNELLSRVTFVRFYSFNTQTTTTALCFYSVGGVKLSASRAEIRESLLHASVRAVYTEACQRVKFVIWK